MRMRKALPIPSTGPMLIFGNFENGISYQESSFIDISFSNEPDQLSFSVKNSNPRMKKDEDPSGIGIDNSRKRLDLIYGDSYTLEIDDKKDEFVVSLNIPV
jgi:sensor histidine kinase YesM